MKKLLLLFLLFTISFSSFSQKMKVPKSKAKTEARPVISKKDLLKIKLLEDSLHILSNNLTMDTSLEGRKKACYAFIPKFVSALKLDNSFYYSFDSIETVSKIYSPDSLFR